MLEKIQVSNFAALGQDIDQCKVDALKEQAVNAVEKLEKGTDKGNDFLGWLHLPSSITETELSDIEATAKSLRESCEFVVAIGIGGSYLYLHLMLHLNRMHTEGLHQTQHTEEWKVPH